MAKKPLLLYDGDCGFCRLWVGRWKALTGDAVEYRPSEEAAEAVQLVSAEGRFAGAEAVFRVLAQAPGRAWWLAAYRGVPPFGAASEAAYRLVARHRPFFSRLTLWLWGKDLEPPSYLLTSRLFLRALCLIYMIAFVSLGVQVSGLLGSRGILPAADYLAAAKTQIGAAAYRLLPTLCWLGASDGSLKLLCWGGAALAACAAAGLAQAPALLGCWALYLSLVNVGQDFMSFQWDILLLETGLLGALLAPWSLKPSAWSSLPPRPGALWLLRWLLFRLMFESGCVKLQSGDPAWRDLTALAYHYQTQPLPTALAWYAHQMPAWFQRLSCGLMFAVELVVPFLIFMPRRPRLLAAASLTGLQVLIALTGNYCFFNLLALALCLSLVDDASVSRFWPLRLPRPLPPAAPAEKLKRLLLPPTAAAIFLIGAGQLWSALTRLPPPGPVRALTWAVSPLHAVNGYGLFAVMTKTRDEISLEGSEDGRDWREWPLRWKPGAPARRPRWAAPHQPRLDWQLWFAALGDYRQNPWFVSLLVRALEGSPPVLALLGPSPFPAGSPRYLRGALYRYRFTTWKEGGGAWWRRERLGAYSPPASLRR